MHSNALATKFDLQPTEFTHDISYDSVGKTLSRIRIEQGHSLEEVTKSTKIRTYFLILLEEDNFNELPGTVFTTGFIRNYCDYLNISAEPLILQYIAQCSKKETEAPFKLYVAQKSEKIITPRVVVISILIICMASALWHLTQNKSINISEMINLEDIKQQEIKHKKVQPTKMDQANVQTEKTINTLIVEPTSIAEPNKDQTIVKNESTSIESPISSEVKVIQESNDFNIEAIEETWLKITNDQGVRLKVSFLKKGEVFSLKPYQGNLISVGNAENVDFVQGNTRIKGAEYLGTANGFAESKKIVVPQTPDMVQSLASDTPKSVPIL